MAKLTPQQKEDKRKRDQLLISNNRLLSAWNFGDISSWEGIYSKLGIPTPPGGKIGPATFQELKEYIALRVDRLEKEILIANAATPAIEKELKHEQTIKVATASAGQEQTVPIRTELIVPSSKGLPADDTESVKFSSVNNYGFVSSPNEAAKLFWFQKKAVAEGMDKLI
jgi:hypothetical protein